MAGFFETDQVICSLEGPCRKTSILTNKQNLYHLKSSCELIMDHGSADPDHSYN
jgi:hypothetical protein